MQQHRINALQPEPSKRLSQLALHPAGHVVAGIRDGRQLGHYLKAAQIKLAQYTFALTVRDCGIQGIHPRLTRTVENPPHLVDTHLTLLVGDAIGQAKLNSAQR